uniref:OO_Ba0013J05-OO_Ba0033A15.29 protein n=1 Tax=Oryza officinalis TaxID=4535 RepID=D0ABH2_9ORYZ|nr:OO_Ba0013J05-OO_Ba0033A15.29 [Oryza officinalis]
MPVETQSHRGDSWHWAGVGDGDERRDHASSEEAVSCGGKCNGREPLEKRTMKRATGAPRYRSLEDKDRWKKGHEVTGRGARQRHSCLPANQRGGGRHEGRACAHSLACVRGKRGKGRITISMNLKSHI